MRLFQASSMFPGRFLCKALVSICVCLVWAAGPAVLANPLPGGAVIVHIHEPDEGFCEESINWLCEDIQQYTQMTGLLQFELFLYSYMLPDGITGAELSVAWPAEWTCLEASLCEASDGSVEVSGDGAAVQAFFTSTDPDRFTFPFASFLLQVDGEGWLAPVGEVFIRWGEQGYEPIEMVPGHAGVTCGYTYLDCDFGLSCRPDMTPGHLLFELPEGASGQRVIHADSYIDPDCWPTFDVIGEWLSIAVDSADNRSWEWELTVTADATGLAEGEYTGWVRGVAEAVRCTRVDLLVTAGTQSIPGDWGPDEPTLTTTWGALKSLYRE